MASTAGSRTGRIGAAVAISGHLDTRTAATEIASMLHDELSKAADAKAAPPTSLCDLCLVFGSFHHRTAFEDACSTIRTTLSPQVIIGATAEAVLGADSEMEGVSGLSVMALRVPNGATLTPWHWDSIDHLPLNDPESVARRIGADKPDFRFTILLGDPFTPQVDRLLSAVSVCRAANNLATPIVGGMASGASQPGLNVIVVNDHVASSGAVGVSFAGNIDADFIVSQGCRPIGQPHVITKLKDHVLLELGGRKAMEVLQETAEAMDERERSLLSKGVLVGTVINEYKPRFGRGDFLVRNIGGFDQRAGGIVIGPGCKVGQTIQFHVRDADTATEDLQLLLEPQGMAGSAPAAGLLFTCNGRGTRLFSEPNHDVGVITTKLPGVPLAGFFAAGEIGPIGNKSFIHGHTASLVLLRERAKSES